MDNAGGSQILQKVINRMNDYLLNSNVQLGASYKVSELAGKNIDEANRVMGEFINARSKSEIIMGGSTTMLLNQLAASFGKVLKPGDEIVVTDCDHEANIGAWRKLERFGIVIREWQINLDDFRLHLDDLGKIMNDKTKLVAVTNSSNIIGTTIDVKEITGYVHKRGALICVDGVAYVPHRAVDVQKMDIDFYVFSFYKLYGTHSALLYGKQELLEKLPGINHYFIDEEEVPYKFQPGNQNYELSYGALGITDYISEMASLHGISSNLSLNNKSKEFFNLIKVHEEELMNPIMDLLNSKSNIKIIGEDSYSGDVRVPTISFIVDGVMSNEIVEQVDKHKIGIRYGHFYAKRLIDNLGLEKQNGVVRISLVHYNTLDEVNKLVTALDEILN
jgi:cysteine desulfurase family protein (TIGR01976 family)